jgi:hypothetical protein
MHVCNLNFSGGVSVHKRYRPLARQFDHRKLYCENHVTQTLHRSKQFNSHIHFNLQWSCMVKLARCCNVLMVYVQLPSWTSVALLWLCMCAVELAKGYAVARHCNFVMVYVAVQWAKCCITVIVYMCSPGDQILRCEQILQYCNGVCVCVCCLTGHVLQYCFCLFAWSGSWVVHIVNSDTLIFNLKSFFHFQVQQDFLDPQLSLYICWKLSSFQVNAITSLEMWWVLFINGLQMRPMHRTPPSHSDPLFYTTNIKENKGCKLSQSFVMGGIW